MNKDRQKKDERFQSMSYEDEISHLKQEIERLRSELSEARGRTVEPASNGSGGASAEAADLPGSFAEYDIALKRLVQRTAMIVQAEKCVIMVRDKETGDLQARSPAWGMTDEQVFGYRIPVENGFSGEVFRASQSQILVNAIHDRRAAEENLQAYGVRNSVTVPLLVEKHDENNRVVEQSTIGVLHCFNKRFGGEFVDEDVRLLERLARNAAAVISNAIMYQEVMEEKQKLVQTLESLASGLILVNQKGNIAQINASARKMFHLDASANPVDKPYAEILQHEACSQIMRRAIDDCLNPEAAAKRLEQELHDGVQRPVEEITIVNEDEDAFIYQVLSAGVRDAASNLIGTVFIFNDITAIRHVERMKTEFVSIVSHELRTPLTPIKGFVRTLLDDENEEWYAREDRREFYIIIEQQVDRLNRLISDLLNVARIERGAGIEMNWQQVNIRNAANSVIETQEARSDKHTLTIDFEPDTFEAESDPDIIQNILHNLVSNAIKYSEGGEVRIIGRLEEPAEEYPDGSVLMGVKDNGIGLSEGDVKKIGEKFFRSSNKQARAVGGTGLGLFLVKSLVAAHHGVMWVESELGKGSTFWFRLPAKQPKQAEENTENKDVSAS